MIQIKSGATFISFIQIELNGSICMIEYKTIYKIIVSIKLNEIYCFAYSPRRKFSIISFFHSNSNSNCFLNTNIYSVIDSEAADFRGR